jgi:hypothetical protein
MKLRGSTSLIQAYCTSGYLPGINKILLLDLMHRTDRWGTDLALVKKLEISTYSASKELFTGLELHVDGSATLPRGVHFTRRSDLLRVLNQEISSNKFIHELVCIVEPGCSKITGLMLTITREEDDLWDEDLVCEVMRKLVRGHKAWDLDSINYQPKKTEEGKFKFDIELPEKLWDDGNQEEDQGREEDEEDEDGELPSTARLDFLDSHDPTVVYGSLFIRLVPTPSAARLLPVGSSFVDASIRRGKELMILKVDPLAQPLPLAPILSPIGPEGAESSQLPSNFISDPHATLTGWKLETDKGSYPFDPWKDQEVIVEGIIVKRDVSVLLRRIFRVTC